MDWEGSLSKLGVALQPLMDIEDKVAIAYEALPRPRTADPGRIVDAALAASAIVSPASLLVPLMPSLLADPSFDPAARAAAAGVLPEQVVWLVPHIPTGTLRMALRSRARELHTGRFRVALGGVDIFSIDWQDTAEIRPSFLLLAEALSESIDDVLNRAALAGLLAFSGRIGARIVARGVDDDRIARSYVEVGVFSGTGLHLQAPVVLDRSFAAEGDEVVRAAWFRERSIRVIGGQKSAPREALVVVRAPPPSAELDERALARVLGEAARRVEEEREPLAVMHAIAELLPQIVPVDRLAIWEADWDAYRLVPRVVIGDELESLASVDHHLGTGITGSAFLRGTPFNCPDTGADPDAASVPGQREEPAGESLIVIPIIAGSNRLGVLDVWRDGRSKFSEYDVERCAVFGHIAAAAWHNANLYKELENRSVTDNLTGLLNHRWWAELAPREAAQALRNGSQIAVLYVDLDEFKLVNDTYGHAAGDLVLRGVGVALRRSIRSGDAAVRYGGDEFILLLRDCDDQAALQVADQVRKSLDELPSAAVGIEPTTASIGVASFPRHGLSLDDVVHAADSAMYQSKAAGHDQVTVFGGAPTAATGK